MILVKKYGCFNEALLQWSRMLQYNNIKMDLINSVVNIQAIVIKQCFTVLQIALTQY